MKYFFRVTIIGICLLGTLHSFAQSKRVLAISGGGSRGAWGGGVAKQFAVDSGRNYQCVFGTSLGSLIAPLVVSNNFKKMEVGFTDINQQSIFNKNPFKANGKIKAGRAFLKVLTGAPNLGETENLKKRIKEFFSEEEYQAFRKNKKTIVVSTVSLTTNRLEYKSSDTISSYERMVNWVWASANQPVFMTAVPMDGELWVDGGVKENVPIEEAVNYARNMGIDTVDVIVLNIPDEHPENWPNKGEKKNVIPKILRTINIFSDEIKTSDIKIGLLSAKSGKEIQLNIYYMSQAEYDLAPQSLLFVKKKQKALWESGYKHQFAINKAVRVLNEKIKGVTVTTYF